MWVHVCVYGSEMCSSTERVTLDALLGLPPCRLLRGSDCQRLRKITHTKKLRGSDCQCLRKIAHTKKLNEYPQRLPPPPRLPPSLTEKTRAPFFRKLDAQANSFRSEAGKPQWKQAPCNWGHGLRNRKEHSPTPRPAKPTPDPGAVGHRQPGARTAAASRRRRAPTVPQSGFTAAQGGGFRSLPAPGLRLQVHTECRRPLPSWRALARSLGPARPFFSIQEGAQCHRRRPPDWLAAAARALSHGPRLVWLTRGAADAALASGQANGGARSWTVAVGSPMFPPRLPRCLFPSPPLLLGSQPEPGGADAPPPGPSWRRGRA